MKLIFKTKNNNKTKTYQVHLPNYYDVTKVDELLEEIRFEIAAEEKVVEHQFYSDTALSIDERKQLDTHGKVINPPIELTIS